MDPLILSLCRAAERGEPHLRVTDDICDKAATTLVVMLSYNYKYKLSFFVRFL